VFIYVNYAKKTLSPDLNADPDQYPDAGTQENANSDPDPGTLKMQIQCGSGSGTLDFILVN